MLICDYLYMSRGRPPPTDTCMSAHVDPLKKRIIRFKNRCPDTHSPARSPSVVCLSTCLSACLSVPICTCPTRGWSSSVQQQQTFIHRRTKIMYTLPAIIHPPPSSSSSSSFPGSSVAAAVAAAP
eukprot:GHVU01078205.1.p3 GENE.GHVU01078205.1~~GHVU01078205.1.p3  ORF type:complete len:125 (-),score=19.42 GHVU01078205.1:867-1241(-)